MTVSKPLLQSTLLLTALVLITFCLLLIASTIFRKPTPSRSTSPTITALSLRPPAKVQQIALKSGWPVRLKIPEISIDAALDYVRLTPQGALGTPSGPADAGWYDVGPRPGETGDAVIDGHFGWKNHIPAVFDNLHLLQTGDNLYVVDERGITTTFVVRELRIFGQNDDDSVVFHDSDNKAHLNLITCEGTWNAALGSFSNRLVVFTDKVPS